MNLLFKGSGAALHHIRESTQTSFKGQAIFQSLPTARDHSWNVNPELCLLARLIFHQSRPTQTAEAASICLSISIFQSFVSKKPTCLTPLGAASHPWPVEGVPASSTWGPRCQTWGWRSWPGEANIWWARHKQEKKRLMCLRAIFHLTRLRLITTVE